MHFHQVFGLSQRLFVLSRTKKGVRFIQHGSMKIEHFSIRVCKAAGLVALGMGEEQFHLCKHKSGPKSKGPIASQLGLTHFVDNDWENLESVCHHATNSMKMIIFYDNSPASSSLGRNKEIAASRNWGDIQCHVVESWPEIAALVGLPRRSLHEWAMLRNLTPPFCRYNPVQSLAVLDRRRHDRGHDTGVDSDDAAPSRTWKSTSSAPSDPEPVAKVILKPVAKTQSQPVPDTVSVSDTETAAEPEWVRSMAASAKSLAASAKQFAAPPPPPPPPPPPQQIDPDELKRVVSTAIAETLASDNIKRRILGTDWYTKKQQRAERHAATQAASSKSSSVPISKALGSAPRRFLPKPAMCATCDKSQPGAYCCRGMCRPCCLDAARTGGSDKVCQQPQHALPMQ